MSPSCKKVRSEPFTSLKVLRPLQDNSSRLPKPSGACKWPEEVGNEKHAQGVIQPLFGAKSHLKASVSATACSAAEFVRTLLEMVPVPIRSPGRRLQPLAVWWAIICSTVQYLQRDTRESESCRAFVI